MIYSFIYFSLYFFCLANGVNDDNFYQLQNHSIDSILKHASAETSTDFISKFCFEREGIISNEEIDNAEIIMPDVVDVDSQNNLTQDSVVSIACSTPNSSGSHTDKSKLNFMK